MIEFPLDAQQRFPVGIPDEGATTTKTVGRVSRYIRNGWRRATVLQRRIGQRNSDRFAVTSNDDSE